MLCTDDHTYQLRQVQSSNSIFILQPSESILGDDHIPTPSLLAIAQCTATLELIPSDTAASIAMASRLLKKSLPLYKGIDTELGLGVDTTFSSMYEDKNAILQNAPFSTVEFDKAWKQSCAFEVLGRAFLPTASALAFVWKSILSAATIRGIDIEKNFDLESLADMVGTDGYPRALFIAVVMRLVSETDYLRDDYVSLDRDKTVQWVGIACLQRIGESEQINMEVLQSEFLAQWHNLLPEGWRKHASMDLLNVKYSHLDPTKEKSIFGEDIYDPTSSETLPSDAGGKTNRKWHEKFKMGRK